MGVIAIKRFIRDLLGFSLKDISLGDYHISEKQLDYCFFYMKDYKFKLRYEKTEHRYILYACVENFGFVELSKRC